MTPMTAGYANLARAELAALVPELLLCGQMIDRSGMAHLIAEFGRQTMTRVAIEEWMAASPVYTSRMRAALGIDGDGVADMFKCLQLDIGAPPQFMDFRFEVADHDHGAFVLDHCGALMDVEPMGDDYVTAMCHDIEDPTFDATAIATNRRARIRPIHRPPRRPADRVPHCAWSVTIEPDRDELPLPADAQVMFGTRAAGIELSAIDSDAPDGRVDYRGPLSQDLQFREWSHSALVRIAEEVALQHQLLALGFRASVDRYAQQSGQTAAIVGKQLTGIAGLAADRVRRALHLGNDAAALAKTFAMHPVFGPHQYTRIGAESDADGMTVTIPTDSGAVADGGWAALLASGHVRPIQAAATAVDPHWCVVSTRPATDGQQIRIEWSDQPADEYSEVSIARISSGATFSFADRGPSIPITPVSTR